MPPPVASAPGSVSLAELKPNLSATGAPGPLLLSGLVLIPGTGTVVQDGALVVESGVIKDLGGNAEVAARWPAAARIHAGGYVATPGLVNAHTHAAMGFFRGLGHGIDNMIETFMFPAEKSLTPELLEPLAYSYLYAGLTSGVTCFGDHYYFIEGIAKALDRFGLRGAVGETVADLGGAFPGAAATRHWQRWRDVIANWPYSSRVTPVVAPHAADTVSPALLAELAQFAKTARLPLHMHLSQTAGERSRVLAREGQSPVRYADRCGALTEQAFVVHLVTADAEDIAVLKARGVRAGICPASQIIYERLAPVADLLAAGVPLALGTDCAASNDGTDLLSEGRLMALLCQDRGVPAAARSPANILAMLTRNGAEALGLGTVTGTLAVGKAADVVFLAQDLGSDPAPRPEVNLLFSMSSRNVRHVMVDGRFVLHNGHTTLVDETALRAEYNAAVLEIKRRIQH